MSSDRVPMRHSLVTRLLVTSVLIAIVSISATAWLATTTTTRAISQEQGTAAADDKAAYRTLIDYATTHRDWSEVSGVLDETAGQIRRRITLTTENRTVIHDSTPGPTLGMARPSTVVDPLDLDLSLAGRAERIDPRVVGPYLVPPDDRGALHQSAIEEADCVRKIGSDRQIDYAPTITVQPSGRPKVVISGGRQTLGLDCHLRLETLASRPEQAALQALTTMTARCLGLGDRTRRLRITPDYNAYLADKAILRAPGQRYELAPSALERIDDEATRTCLEAARRTQLRPYVPPRALLFVTALDSQAGTAAFSLSRGNVLRIAAVTGAVLLATIAVTIIVGRRLVGPLRNLADSAEQHTPALAATRDEIGRLARALNDSTERRERAEAQRRTMVNDVAHELRTPLSNIRTWLEAAQDDLAPTDAQLLDLLHDEALLLQHVIDDLSDLAAADAGILRITPGPIHLRDTLTQVVSGHRTTAETAGVRLHLDVAGNPVVIADEMRLRQLVGNLVSNGIRYTPPGGTVTVAARDTTITVRDTGTGIAAVDLPRIFDRFWRADQSRSRATGGSGLGLAIARQLAEAHGGTIAVESEPGRGTLFTVRLPGQIQQHAG